LPRGAIYDAAATRRTPRIDRARSAAYRGWETTMRRHHWLLVGAVIFILGWFLWNVLLVEEELSAPAATVPAAP
jgi:hypothetical protein